MGYIKSILKGEATCSFYSYIGWGSVSLLLLSLAACTGGSSGGSGGVRELSLPLNVIPNGEGARVSWSYPLSGAEDNRTVYDVRIDWLAVNTKINSTDRVFYLDGDSIGYQEDLCPSINSENNADSDGDGIGDACEPEPNSLLSFVPGSEELLIRWRNEAASSDIAGFRIRHRKAGGTEYTHFVNATRDDINTEFGSYASFLHNGTLDDVLEDGVNYEISLSYVYTNRTEVLAATGSVVVGPNYDGDALADSVDSDDDNDGILDVDEVQDAYFDYSKLSALGDGITLPRYDSNDAFLTAIYDSQNPSYLIRGLPSHSVYIFTVDIKAARLPEGFTKKDYYDRGGEMNRVDFISELEIILYQSNPVVLGNNMDGDSMADFMDGDDDNDGVGDAEDLCNSPSSEMNWQSNPQTDANGDGCRDFRPQQVDRHVLFSEKEEVVYVAWNNPFGSELVTSADLLFLPLGIDTASLNESNRTAAWHIRVQDNATAPFVCRARAMQNCVGQDFGLASYKRPARRAQTFVSQLTEAQAEDYQVMVILTYANSDVVYYAPQPYTANSLKQSVRADIRGGLFYVEWTNDLASYDFFTIRLVDENGYIVEEVVVGDSSLPDSANQPVSLEAGAENIYHFPSSVVLDPGSYTVELEGVTLDDTNQQLYQYFDFTDVVVVSADSYEQIGDDMEMRYDPSSFVLADIPRFYFYSDYDKECGWESILYVLSSAQTGSADCGESDDRVFWASSVSYDSGIVAQVDFPVEEMVYLDSLTLDATTNFFFNSSLNQFEVEYRDVDESWILLGQIGLTNRSEIKKTFAVNDYALSYRLRTRIYEQHRIVVEGDETSLAIRIKEFRPIGLSFSDVNLLTTIARTNDEDSASFDDEGVSYVFYDGDRDGVGTAEDNCPAVANPDQANVDLEVEETRMDLSIRGDACDDEDDRDADGDQVANYRDNCPQVSNPNQSNVDEREERLNNQPLLGDACDEEDNRDFDNDGVDNYRDNCLMVANRDQADSLDHDGIGDACDAIDNRDSDLDGWENYEDNCPYVFNLDQLDSDRDGIGNVCDAVDNDDVDNDTVANEDDNCPMVANTDQADEDGDGTGNLCDPLNDRDFDEDSVLNARDNCPYVANLEQDLDRDGDGIGDVCDPVDDRMALFIAASQRDISYATSGAGNKLIMGDGSASGSAGAFRRLGRNPSGLDEAAVGQDGGGGDDNVVGTHSSDILFGDGSGGGGGARFSHPGSGASSGTRHSNPGGSAGAGNDHIQGNEGGDIIFGDGYDGSPSEGRNNEYSNNNRYCQARGPCDGGDGGYGGGGGGGANVRQPYDGSGTGGTFMSNGGKGGIGAGNGGDVYFELVWGDDSQVINGYYFCSQWNENPHPRCQFIGRDGGSSSLDESYRGGRGTIYDAWYSSHSRERLDCFFGGSSARARDCHASGGGGASLGESGGAGIATTDESTWAATGMGRPGGTDQVEFDIDLNFWLSVREDINFDGHEDDYRVWGPRAQGVGDGDDEINGGRGSDVIITGGGQDVVVLDLTSTSGGSNDFDIDRVLDFDIGDSQCNGDRIKIVRHTRGSVEGEPETIDEESILSGFSEREGILTFTGSDEFGAYYAIVVRDGLRRADNTYRLAALFLYDHHLDTDGVRDRDHSPNQLRPCHLQQ